MKRRIISIFLVLLSYPFFSKSAIVLSGGGAKGAYEVGVWKALDEYALSDDISVFSGTSVGALNATLFSCTTSRIAENIWLTKVTSDNFLNPIDENAKRISDGIFKAAAAKSDINVPMLGFFNNMLNSLSGNLFESFFDIGGKFVDLFTNSAMTGYFQREELKSIISKVFSIEKLNRNSKTVYAAALQKSHMITKLLAGFNNESVDYFNLGQQLSTKNAIDILLASSAFPGAYDSQNLSESTVINGKQLGFDYEYIDGGFGAAGGRNTPINPIMNHDEIKMVYIVYLKTPEELEADPPFSEEELDLYINSNKEFISFAPSEYLGNLFDGILNFDQAKIKHLIELGYNDSIKVLSSNGFLKPPAWARYRTRFL